jgi:hypothetical protein
VPIAERREARICLRGVEGHRHPDGGACPHGGTTERRLGRQPRPCPAARGRGCDGDDTRWPGTVGEPTRPRPAPLGRVRRGVATGEPPARVARALGLSRQPRQTLRQRGPTHLNATAPTGGRTGTALEAEARDQHAGAPTHVTGPAPRPLRGAPASGCAPRTAPRRRRGAPLLRGRAITAAIQAMPLCAMACARDDERESPGEVHGHTGEGAYPLSCPSAGGSRLRGRVVHPGMDAARDRLRGVSVSLVRGRVTLIRSALQAEDAIIRYGRCLFLSRPF